MKKILKKKRIFMFTQKQNDICNFMWNQGKFCITQKLRQISEITQKFSKISEKTQKLKKISKITQKLKKTFEIKQK